MAGVTASSTPVRALWNKGFNPSSFMLVKVKFPGNHSQYSIHRGILRLSSEVMKEQLNSAIVKEMSIGGLKPYDFRLYTNWLYSGRLCTKDDIEEEDNDVDEFSTLVDGYVLGIKLKDSTYCNTIITAIFEKVEQSSAQGDPCLPGWSDINKVYSEDVPNGCGEAYRLRQAFVGIFAREKPSSQLESITTNEGLDRAFAYRDTEKLKCDRTGACEVHPFRIGAGCSVEGNVEGEPSRKRCRQD